MRDGFLRRVFKGYAGLLKGIAFFTVLVGASAALGFLASWPLWLFSTESRTLYSLFCAAAIGAGLVWLIVRAATRRRPERRRRGVLVTVLAVAAFICVLLAGVYGIVYFIYKGSVIILVPLVIVLLVLLGWLAWLAARRRSPPTGPA